MIPIKNIYHMLSYAFRTLCSKEYAYLGTEEFENTLELYAEILVMGMSRRIRKGLHKEYIREDDILTTVRGRIDVSETIRTLALERGMVACSYGTYSADNLPNRTIASTLRLLMRSDLSQERKKEVKRCLGHLSEIGDIDLRKGIPDIRRTKLDDDYRMMISICGMVFDGLLQTEDSGKNLTIDVEADRRVSDIYETFIREYFVKEHPDLKARKRNVDWDIDDEYTGKLPMMQTDIVLEYGNRVLIIDAKYYSHSTMSRYGSGKIVSGNIYQIFTYVKNMEGTLGKSAGASGKLPPEVSGMLLYAKTDDPISPDDSHVICGNRIGVVSLDLNRDFKDIRSQLDSIADHMRESD